MTLVERMRWLELIDCNWFEYTLYTVTSVIKSAVECFVWQILRRTSVNQAYSFSRIQMEKSRFMWILYRMYWINCRKAIGSMSCRVKWTFIIFITTKSNEIFRIKSPMIDIVDRPMSLFWTLGSFSLYFIRSSRLVHVLRYTLAL